MKSTHRTALLIAAIWACAILVLNWGAWKMDLTGIYFAARSWGAGLPDLVYAPGAMTYLVEPPEQWVTWGSEEAWDELFFTPYLYPPLWAVLFSPLTKVVGAGAFFDGALLVSVLASVWMVWLSWNLIRPTRISTSLWAVLSFGLLIGTSVGYMSYWLGQPQILVSAITLAAFVALSNGRDLTAGGLLALAAAAKLSPAVLVVLFIMERRWRAVASFAGVGAGLAILSILLAGWPLHAEMLTKLSAIEEQVLFSRILVSIELALLQLQGLVQGTAEWSIGQPHMVMEPGWISWVVRTFLVVGLVVTWWRSRNLPDRERIFTRVLGTLMVTLLANPLGWVHYLVLPFLLLPGLYEFMSRRAAFLTILVVGLLFSMPLFLFLSEIPKGDFFQVTINMGVSAAILVISWMLPGLSGRHTGAGQKSQMDEG